ncbi:MAG: SIS domain-containing protein [Christensenellaceae bacterium]|nr:SIS domain-containing protein [Christensenellaceae bacterium]MEA5067287.1 SIS domain-containing protein [Eubacteriales bacterium]MEA5068428.1 SIS domain-containing protein [Christensenellaceae bacterium]
MQKNDFNNTLRMQCLDVEALSMVQFDRSVASFHGLLPNETVKRVKRIVATGCGDSFLAAAEARAAFAKYLPDVEYETPTAIEAGRYADFADDEPDTVVVALSVSGSPARIAEILERGNRHGCVTIALTDAAKSRAAKTAKLLYHTNTPAGDNVSGLRTYYVSMISLYVMAAAMAEIRTGKAHLQDLKEQVAAYKDAFFAQIGAIDDICFKTAVAWKQKKVFEVMADGPMFFCGKFIAAKFAELSGDVCSVIDSENYFHVNSLMYPGEDIGEMAIIASYEANVDRIADTVNSQAGRGKRDVILFSDKGPGELGITEKVTHCPMPVPPAGYGFLLPLLAFIPASILASYRAATIGEPFFRGGGSFPSMTLGDNPIVIL